MILLQIAQEPIYYVRSVPGNHNCCSALENGSSTTFRMKRLVIYTDVGGI